MEYAVGVVLALAISLFATLVGFDRSRTFYSFLLMVIASYYALFALMGASPPVLLAEVAFMAVFFTAATAGYKRSMWLVAAGLFAHGVTDFFHGHVIANAGVPRWWPGFCGSYDVVAAGYLAWRLMGSRALTPSMEG
jgi:hypothetical protein